jgi:hypothetical protein
VRSKHPTKGEVKKEEEEQGCCGTGIQVGVNGARVPIISKQRLIQ